MSKIFCIGYPRTGTHSLAAALKKLGFNCWHYHTQSYYDLAVRILKTRNIEHRIFNQYDAFADTPIFYVYKELDQKFPGSKFILTTRNRDDWHDSMKWLMKHTEKTHPERNEHNRFMWKNLNRDMIYQHTVGVMNYFSKRLHRLLIKDIETMNYADLAFFLGTKPIDEPFPHENKRHGN